jgi:hypothetical protein
MLAATLTAPAPASAFTLASPNLGHSFAADGQLDKVWWDRWGRWHPNWGPRWGWRPGWGWRRPGWGWGPRRHCWMSPWGWRCRWW